MVDYLQQRTAAERAGFLLGELRPGMRLLDCGCGPGSMTLDLAAAVAPGEVVGVDLNPRMIEIALSIAGQRGVGNVRFEKADVYQLPFEDESFDVVFLHTLLMHLERPVDALIEARRVLRSGGLIAVCDGDWAADIQAPTFTLLEQAKHLAVEMLRMSGTNVYFGRQHRNVLRRAGFKRIRASATAETYGSPEATRNLAESNVRLMSEMAARAPLPVDPMGMEFLTRAWQAWGNHPDAFFSRMRAEALAWKE
jgi:ubiquinone/menaquinone biosynthesis C-methylase UbiE